MVTLEEKDRPAGYPQKLARFLAVTFAAILLVFGFSVVAAGVTVLFTKGALTAKAGGTLAVGITLFGAGAYSLYRLNPFAFLSEPVSDSVRKTRRSVMWSTLFGVVLGLALALSDPQLNAFSNGPVDRTIAIVLTLAYAVLTPLFAIYWHKNADEFEKTAYEKGALLGIYAYSFITPGWWMLTRAKVLPPQDPMIVFLIVTSIWGICWIANKSN